MMTKKHYVAIASALMAARLDISRKEEPTSDLLDGVSYAAEHMADYFQSENPKFNRGKFLNACGLLCERVSKGE